jgi:hypothetical protein
MLQFAEDPIIILTGDDLVCVSRHDRGLNSINRKNKQQQNETKSKKNNKAKSTISRDSNTV